MTALHKNRQTKDLNSFFWCRDALEQDDDLEKVLKKAFLDADKALHTHLSYFNNGETQVISLKP